MAGCLVAVDHSITLNPSLDSDNDMDLEEVQQPIQHIVAQHPVAPLDPIQLGIVRVVYGPVLPPNLIWERSFRSLLPEFFIRKVPASLSTHQQWQSQLTTCVLPEHCDFSFGLLMKHCNPPVPRSSVVIEEIFSDHVEPQVSAHEQVEHVQPSNADSP